MGWNAAACVIEKDFYGKGDDKIVAIRDVPEHPALADFGMAKAALKAAGSPSDVTFDLGLLCVRATGRALFDAVGQPMVHCGIRTAEEVQDMAKAADWSLTSEAYEDYEKATAKAFLEVCAKHNLGIDLG